MEKQIEYEALREKILLAMQTVKNYRSLLYTLVVAALAFAFDKGIAINGEPVLIRLPICSFSCRISFKNDTISL